MVEKLRELGRVKLTQLQPSGLIIETPSGYFYYPSRRVVVDRLKITRMVQKHQPKKIGKGITVSRPF